MNILTFPIKHNAGTESCLTVNYLLETETHSWDVDKIMSMFNPRVIAEILKLNLGHCPQPEKWFWKAEKSGNFTVKSAYRLLEASAQPDQAESSHASSIITLWKQLWKMRVPPKIKNFAWRAYRDTLPTRCNLIKRKVHVTSICCFCQIEEDVAHALIYYS